MATYLVQLIQDVYLRGLVCIFPILPVIVGKSYQRGRILEGKSFKNICSVEALIRGITLYQMEAHLRENTARICVDLI